MQWEIVCRGIELDVATADRIEVRLGHALDRFADRVARVSVRLHDANGPRGGVDKCVRIVVELPGVSREPVIVDDAAADLPTLIDRAADRVGQAVRRRVERSRSHSSVSTRRFAVEAQSSATAEAARAAREAAAIDAAPSPIGRGEIERLQRIVNTRLGARVDGFHVLVENGGLVLRGRAATPYLKQLVELEAAAESGLPVLRNELEISWFPSTDRAAGDDRSGVR